MALTEKQIKEHLLDISVWEDNIKDLELEQEYTSSPTKIHKIGKEITELKDKIAKTKLSLSANNTETKINGIKLTANQVTKLSKFKVRSPLKKVVITFPSPLRLNKVKAFFTGYNIRIIRGSKKYVAVIELTKKVPSEI